MRIRAKYKAGLHTVCSWIASFQQLAQQPLGIADAGLAQVDPKRPEVDGFEVKEAHVR